MCYTQFLAGTPGWRVEGREPTVLLGLLLNESQLHSLLIHLLIGITLPFVASSPAFCPNFHVTGRNTWLL